MDPATCLWNIEHAGGENHKVCQPICLHHLYIDHRCPRQILVPNKDLVWTVKESATPKAVSVSLLDIQGYQ